MTSRINIKEVIETLCQILHRHGFSKLHAEVLRQAKFNKKEASKILLNLIFEILTLEKPLLVDNWDDHKKYYFVISVLKRLDYPKLLDMVFMEVPQSSREILLAFGFIITRLNIMAVLRHKTENMITEEFLNACKMSPNNNKSIVCNNIDHVIRLYKMVDLKHRAILGTSSYLDKLLSKFSLIDNTVIIGELYGMEYATKRAATILDLIFFDNVRLQQQMLSVLHEQVELLKLHIKWLQHEHLFWRWLSSILKESAREEVETKCSSRLKLKDNSNNITHILPYHLVLCDKDFLDQLVPPGHVIQTLKPRDQYLVHLMEQLLKNEILFEEDKQSTQPNIENARIKIELEALNTKISQLEDQNKEYLSVYLDAEHPDLVHFPELKKQ